MMINKLKGMVSFEFCMSAGLTIIMAIVGALSMQIKDLQSSHFEVPTIYATKGELKEAVVDVNQNLNTFIDRYDVARHEDRENFGAIMNRIETRQQENMRDIKKLNIHIARLTDDFK